MQNGRRQTRRRDASSLLLNLLIEDVIVMVLHNSAFIWNFTVGRNGGSSRNLEEREGGEREREREREREKEKYVINSFNGYIYVIKIIIHEFTLSGQFYDFNILRVTIF